MGKPKFFQSVLKEVKGDVFQHVYPHLKGREHSFTLQERLGSEEGECWECGGNSWIILAEESCAVQEGGKPYIECMHCGVTTHL